MDRSVTIPLDEYMSMHAELEKLRKESDEYLLSLYNQHRVLAGICRKYGENGRRIVLNAADVKEKDLVECTLGSVFILKLKSI